jgi:carbonic anhydrase
MLTFTDEDFRRSLQEEVGIKPNWTTEAFSDSRRTSASRLPASRRARSSRTRRACGALSIYEVETGRLREVAARAS